MSHWIMIDGFPLCISDMDTKHIQECTQKILAKWMSPDYAEDKDVNQTEAEQLERMKLELRLRKAGI